MHTYGKYWIALIVVLLYGAMLYYMYNVWFVQQMHPGK